MKYLTFLIVILTFSGCDRDGDSEQILEEMTYRRSACYGICPVYSIEIDPNRTMRYIGKQYVAVKDTIYESVSKEQLIMLTAAFNECNYFSMNDNYTRMNMTDQATIYTSIRINGTNKSVNHYTGDSSAPDDLDTLYSKIETILNVKRLIGE